LNQQQQQQQQQAAGSCPGIQLRGFSPRESKFLLQKFV
jgi:hypothetical protein